MEEHSELEKEAEQVSHTRIGEVEVRNGENEKPQQIGEEARKRKRGVDVVGEEQRKNRVENFISEMAVALNEEILKHRGFIAERGFKNITPPFAEMVEKREW